MTGETKVKYSTAFFVIVLLTSFGLADDLPFPQSVPPVIGMVSAKAAATDNASKKDDAQPSITVNVPKVRWKVVGEIVPKESWPKLEAQVDNVSITLKLGGPSQLAESRFMSLNGDELEIKTVLSRLQKPQPVLISLNGEMPESYYLQTSRPETLILILGPRDGMPAPELLPAAQK